MTGCDSNDLTSPRRPRLGLYLAGVTLLAGLAGLSATAAADYQDTLAARGADAFTPPMERVTLDVEELAEAFSPESIETDPALSDQEVMIDLHERMAASDQLSDAANNLAPAVEDGQDEVLPATSAVSETPAVAATEEATSQPNNADDTAQTAATVAAR